MNIGFFSFTAGHFLNLLFDHGTQRLKIHDLLAPNTFVNTLPNRDEASKMSDFGAGHLLIVRRLKVVNEPIDHLIFHHRGSLVWLAHATILGKTPHSSFLFS